MVNSGRFCSFFAKKIDPKKLSLLMFRGRVGRNIDAKGRIMFPLEFRETLVKLGGLERFVLTTYDNCLVGYLVADWEDLEAKFSELTNSTPHLRNFRRLVLGGAEYQDFDAQGRIRLSKTHLDYAKIDKDIVIVGQGSRFEIWDQTSFNNLMQENFDDVAQELQASGINFAL